MARFGGGGRGTRLDVLLVMRRLACVGLPLFLLVVTAPGCVSGHKASRSTPLRDAAAEAVEMASPSLGAPPDVEREAARELDAGRAGEVGDGPRVAVTPAAVLALAHAVRAPVAPELPPLPPLDVALPLPGAEATPTASPSPSSSAPSPADALPARAVTLRDARIALGRASVAGCRARGLPDGYGHARVTFDASGRAIRVLVDGAEGLPRDAITCVGERLGAATVEAFDGSPITVGTTWYAR